MNENKTPLLKIFSIVLKDRVKSEPQYQSISTEMVKHFSRKELIEIISHNFEGEVPSEFNLVEMENNELLLLIGDDFKIISYVMSKWSKEASRLPTLQEWKHSKVHSDSSETDSKIDENPPENLEISSKTDSVSTIHDMNSEMLKNDVSEAPKSTDVPSVNKKLEEKPSAKKPEKAKNT